jgi:hypothetical protein
VERGVWLRGKDGELIVIVLSLQHRGGVDFRNFPGERCPAVLAMPGCGSRRHLVWVAAATAA